MFYKKRRYGTWLYAVIAVLIIAFVILPFEQKDIVVSIAMIIFGVLQLEKPVWLAMNSCRIKRDWVNIESVIIRSQYEPKTRYIHIEMETVSADGMRIPFIRRDWCWLMPMPRIGKTMTILYDPTKRSDFLVKPEYIVVTISYLILATIAIGSGLWLLLCAGG